MYYIKNVVHVIAKTIIFNKSNHTTWWWAS